MIKELASIAGRLEFFKSSLFELSFRIRGPFGSASAMRFDGKSTFSSNLNIALAHVEITDSRTLVSLRIQQVFSSESIESHIRRILVLSVRSIVEKISASQGMLSLSKKVGPIASKKLSASLMGM